jgi:hypothetical protein
MAAALRYFVFHLPSAAVNFQIATDSAARRWAQGGGGRDNDW